MKSFLQNNDIEIYSMHNEGKSIITERFIRTLKNKIYKYMTSVSKIVCSDKLGDMINKYNNTYHSSVKMKPVDVKSSTYIDSSKEINDKDPKFKIDDTIRTSKCKNIFAKGCSPNRSEEDFVIQSEFRIEKVIKKSIDYMLNEKDKIIRLIAGYIKKT